MAEQEVKQRVTIEGQEALNFLARLQREQEKATKAVKDSGEEAEKASQGTGALTRGFGGLANVARGLVGGLLGTGGVLAAFRLIKEEAMAAARATEEFARASLNLQFLSQTFDPQQREFVTRAAVLAGRGQSETTRAFADLRSRFPNLSEAEVQSLFLEVAETARTTDAPLGAIGGAFATARQFINDPRAAQNALRESIIQAGVGDPAQLAPLFARAVPTLIGTGGLTAGQAFGAVAGATGLGLSGEVAATGLNNVTLGLTGRGTPQGNAIIQRLGIDQTNLLTALEGISQSIQSGRLDPKDLEVIAGREGLPVLQLLSDPQRLASFKSSVGAVATATGSSRDLTREAIENQFRADRAGATNFALQQARAEQARLRQADPAALEAELAKILLENELRGQGAGPIRRAVSGFEFSTMRTLGFDNESALGIVSGLSGSDAGVNVAGQIGEARGGGILFDNRNITINNNPINNGAADPATAEVGKSELP